MQFYQLGVQNHMGVYYTLLKEEFPEEWPCPWTYSTNLSLKPKPNMFTLKSIILYNVNTHMYLLLFCWCNRWSHSEENSALITQSTGERNQVNYSSSRGSLTNVVVFDDLLHVF